MKLSDAWRRDADFNDAVHIVRQIGNKDKEKALKESILYKNFSPHTDDKTYKKHFDRTWADAFE